MFNKEIMTLSEDFLREDLQNNYDLRTLTLNISDLIHIFSDCTKKESRVCINMASYLFLIGDL